MTADRRGSVAYRACTSTSACMCTKMPLPCQGSLYPALQRLEKEGLVASEWGTSANNRRARYYRLTAAGRRALGGEMENWRRFAAGLEAVLCK